MYTVNDVDVVGVQSVPRVECPPGQKTLVLIVPHGLSALVLIVLTSAKCPLQQ